MLIGTEAGRDKDTLVKEEICIPGYTLFRQDRPSQKKEGAL